MPPCTEATKGEPMLQEEVITAKSAGDNAPTDTIDYGDAESDGYVVIKHAIPEDIITEIKVDENEFEVSPSGQYKVFRKVTPGQVVEHFVKHVSKQPLIDLGVSKINAEKAPKVIIFGQYLVDTSKRQSRFAGPPSSVYVTIATSERLSPEEGLPEFVYRSHKITQVRTLNEIFAIDTVKITLHKGWAVAWTSELSYQNQSSHA
ncbi:hypothetical protein K469DRAFT_745368 [Zopfia rhizophila CBS 207.26]|uniref:Uncharacterized protein n=1 Tax=Zopfia rhizophila CBS 207.26 TaxID=1314779 RepID=A0A6A6EMW4_9PEZI|nr:hypothetical protein K469DRAFT_745368 [Zopfia rhizophila CBS 207.26]